MQLSLLTVVLAAVCSAAPHVQNGHQNRRHHRRALLHEDMMALYNAAQTSSSQTSSSDAAATATAVAQAHGPYAAGELHGGNTLNALAAVAVTASASATDSAASAVSTSADWVVAAASRNTTMFSHSYNAGSDDSDDSSDSDSDDEDSAPASKSSGVPTWAIALVVVFSFLSASGLATFFLLRHKKTLNKEIPEDKEEPKEDTDDALSSYKAFWEQKRQSAGSFVSADATPAAVASDLVASSITRADTLPLYAEQDNSNTPAATPVTENAPPRGFLYQ